jgi:hypothetical protein
MRLDALSLQSISALTMRILILLTGCLMCLVSNAASSLWPVERAWTETEEASYSRWVARLAARQWRSVDVMLKTPNHNALYEESDRSLKFRADCADLPYVLRAYYASKRRLPFLYNTVDGGRYGSRTNHTRKTVDNLSYPSSLQSFYRAIERDVHSGNFRTSPETTDSFTYPVAIHPTTVRPGCVFYSPDGHVCIVAAVHRDGSVFLLDAHPDQTITRIRFSPKLRVAHPRNFGGFRAYRKVIATARGDIQWHGDNRHQANFGTEQYAFKDFHGDVSSRLATVRIDPIAAFDAYVRDDLLRDLLNREEAVQIGWKIAQERAISIPSNIYNATGDWEAYSTPSRDLRLRLAFLHLPKEIQRHLDLFTTHPDRLKTRYRTREQLGRALLKRKETLFKKLSVHYGHSSGEQVRVTLSDIESRLFQLSFDPNHAPELRWGGSGEELGNLAALSPRHNANFDRQQPWRNRLTKKQGPMRSTDRDNPAAPPYHDLSEQIEAVIRNQQSATTLTMPAIPRAMSFARLRSLLRKRAP